MPMTFRLTNNDPCFAHNLAVKGADPDGSDFVGLPPAQSGETVDYLAPQLAAGTFSFFCVPHPNMIGTLVPE